MDTNGRFDRIFLATDGSQASEAAVDATIAIAKSPTVRVKVAHVWNLELRHRHGHWDVEMRSEAEALVDETVMRLFTAGVIAERQIIRADRNHVAAAIALQAEEFGADLIVIGTRGLSDWQSLTNSSIGYQLLCSVNCPVLIARGRSIGAPGTVQKVLMAIAGAADVAPAARAAVAVAEPDSSVTVVHVAEAIAGFKGFVHEESTDEIRKTMAQACKLLAHAGVKVQGMVAHQGPVAAAVAEIAKDWDADVIVIGSSRMGDIGSLFLGSVSHDLLHIADRPVVIAERVSA